MPHENISELQMTHSQEDSPDLIGEALQSWYSELD
jgi:hypothetical protein